MVGLAKPMDAKYDGVEEFMMLEERSWSISRVLFTDYLPQGEK